MVNQISQSIKWSTKYLSPLNGQPNISVHKPGHFGFKSAPGSKSDIWNNIVLSLVRTLLTRNSD